jgi:ATP-dependent Clp protease, protease subunit
MITCRKISARFMENRTDVQDKQTEATVYLYGDIGGWFGIDHEEFVKNFNSLKADTIHLRIDSGGGDVFAARAMKTAIMQHKAKVIAHIDGIAASAASFLAMGADEIEIVDGGFFMIHNASSFLDILGYFAIDDLDQLLKDIGKEKDKHGMINEAIANDYVKKTKNPLAKIMEWMAAETWFPAKEAVANGFADRIYDGVPVEGSYDLSTFVNTPEPLKQRNQNLSKRALEKALRDVGLSNKIAKSVLAEGYKEDLRDEDKSKVIPVVAEQEHRDVAPVIQRDVEKPKPKKDHVTELLIRAEIAAPSH